MEIGNDYYNSQGNTAEIISLKDWSITLVIMMVPLVNIVMPFVWAFSGNTNPNKANFFKAWLLVTIISSVLVFLLFGSMIFSLISNLRYY